MRGNYSYIVFGFSCLGTWRSSDPLKERIENPRSEQGSERDPAGAIVAFFMYILKSQATNRFYVGQTNDIESRLNKHNNGEVASTKSYRPWILEYFEHFETRSEAIKRERYIKARKSRAYIEKLIRDVAQPG